MRRALASGGPGFCLRKAATANKFSTIPTARIEVKMTLLNVSLVDMKRVVVLPIAQVDSLAVKLYDVEFIAGLIIGKVCDSWFGAITNSCKVG